MNDTRITAACAAIDERIAEHERRLTELKALKALEENIVELRSLRARLVLAFSQDVEPAAPKPSDPSEVPPPLAEVAPASPPPAAEPEEPTPEIEETPAVKASKTPKAPIGEPGPATKSGQLLAFVRAAGSAGVVRADIRDGLKSFDKSYIHMELWRLRGRGVVVEQSVDGEKRIYAAGFAPASKKHAPPPAEAKSKSLPILGRRVVAVEAISMREDLFKCVPLSGTMSAGSCADRQAKASDKSSGSNSKAIAARAAANQFLMCVSCSLGRKVLDQLKANETPTAA